MTFYERVKQEYLSSYEVFLCDGSETFRNNWLSVTHIRSSGFGRQKFN